jgi:plasmid stability protein
MGSITIRNLPEEALRKLGIRAAEEGLSREEFVRRSLLRAAAVSGEWNETLQMIRSRTSRPARASEDDIREDRDR